MEQHTLLGADAAEFVKNNINTFRKYYQVKQGALDLPPKHIRYKFLDSKRNVVIDIKAKEEKFQHENELERFVAYEINFKDGKSMLPPEVLNLTMSGSRIYDFASKTIKDFKIVVDDIVLEDSDSSPVKSTGRSRAKTN